MLCTIQVTKHIFSMSFSSGDVKSAREHHCEKVDYSKNLNRLIFKVTSSYLTRQYHTINYNN